MPIACHFFATILRVLRYSFFPKRPLALCTVTYGFSNSKKNSFRRNYMRKYGMFNFDLKIRSGMKIRMLLQQRLQPIVKYLFSRWIDENQIDSGTNYLHI